MSTFGISQNFRTTSIVGRFGRTVPEKVDEKVDEDVYDDEDEDEDEDASKKARALKASKVKEAADKAASLTKKERISSSTQFASFMNRYAERTADHH